MAERQRFGCLDNWPCGCKQTLSLRFTIPFDLSRKDFPIFKSQLNSKKCQKKARNMNTKKKFEVPNGKRIIIHNQKKGQKFRHCLHNILSIYFPLETQSYRFNQNKPSGA